MSEQLQYIIKLKEVLCLTMTDIGYLLDMSRNDVYDCLDDKKISKGILSSLKKLCEVADIFNKENIDRLDNFLDRPLINSPKLIDYLKEIVDKGFIDKKKTKNIIKIIKDISEREKKDRVKVSNSSSSSSSSSKNLIPLQGGINEFSTSVYIKDI